jgi:hypothetical protein
MDCPFEREWILERDGYDSMVSGASGMSWTQIWPKPLAQPASPSSALFHAPLTPLAAGDGKQAFHHHHHCNTNMFEAFNYVNEIYLSNVYLGWWWW